jgi:histidinol dehydrogenase
MKLNTDLNAILNRKAEAGEEVTRTVREIIESIRLRGDEALAEYAAKFDGYNGGGFVVTEAEIEAGVRSAGADFVRILERAKANISEFHKRQLQNSWSMYRDDGAMLGQIVRPLETVALYVPGGTAALPSTLLMTAIPALLAGVKRLYILTPVKADGRVPDVILAAASVCGISRIYKAGGAHGIAAAAYGTQTIPKADKIAGPGNIYVTTAKKLVYGEVDIDSIAGPSDITIVADGSANPAYIAADLMGQAEHDVLASAVLLCTDAKLICEVENEIDRQIVNLSRRDIIEKSLAGYGAAIHVKNIDEAFALSNRIAPEHLEILTENPLELLPLVKNAGSVFVGEYTPEPLGDYMSGTNHVLPTAGTARFYSPLGVHDFIKTTSYSYYPKGAFAALASDVAAFAEREGLDAHANAVRVRE